MVQIGCVLDVLAEAIERVKISLILPKLLEHPTHMAQVLNGTKFEKAVHLVESFVRRREFILREKRPPLMDHGGVFRGVEQFWGVICMHYANSLLRL